MSTSIIQNAGLVELTMRKAVILAIGRVIPRATTGPSDTHGSETDRQTNSCRCCVKELLGLGANQVRKSFAASL